MNKYKLFQLVNNIPLILLVSVCGLVWFNALAFAADKLSASHIALSLNTYDRTIELISSGAVGSRNNSIRKEDFSTLFARVTAEFENAEIQACRENGIERDRYQSVFNRIFMVKTYVTNREMRDKLAGEIKRRESMTEEELDQEAEKSYREMEEWYDNTGGNITFQDVQRERDTNLKNYLESIVEQNREIEEYNSNLPPNKTLVRVQKEIDLKRSKLNDSRFRPYHGDILREIAQLEEIAEKVARKDKRRKKSIKKPDPIILKKINEPVDTYHAKQENNFYTTLMQNVQDQKDSGQWRKAVKDNNQKKIKELRYSMNKLDKLLADSSLKQASVDVDAVDSVVDRPRLMALSPLPWQDIPRFP